MSDTIRLTPAGRQASFDASKASFLSGRPEDAKFLSQGFSLAAGESKTFEVYGCAVFFDRATPNRGDLQVTFDTCFPFMNVRQGDFLGLGDRQFKRVTVLNTTAGVIAGSFCYSDNPGFIVFGGLS